MLSTRGQMISYAATVALLCGIGIWQISIGKTSLGTALIAAIISVTIVRVIKNRSIEEQKARGLNPYDERTLYIAGRAARLALNAWVMLAALFVLLGSAFGPVMLVNPYDLAAVAMAIPLLIYSGAYYYYNARL